MDTSHDKKLNILLAKKSINYQSDNRRHGGFFSKDWSSWYFRRHLLGFIGLRDTMFVILVFYFILVKTFREAKPHTNIQANDRSDKGKCSKVQFMVSSSGVCCIFHPLFNTIRYSFVTPSVWCIIKYPKVFLCYSLLLLLLFRFFLWTWNEFVIMVRIYTTPVMKVLHKAVNLPGLRGSRGIFTELFVDCGKALLSRESSTHWSSSA